MKELARRPFPMKPLRILVTGCQGLIGKAVSSSLGSSGHEMRGLDLRAIDAESRGDVRDGARMRERLDGCDGVVHLAAVSRVITAEQDPQACWSTNVDALRELFRIVASSTKRPWVLFVSSREVYGQASKLPATEDATLAPVNIYGRSKVAGEELCNAARVDGLRVAVARLSNVFGSTADHADRVVPAFVRAALSHSTIRIDGRENTFDFTHVDDALLGLRAITEALAEGKADLPPVHFVTGVPTTLGELASVVIRLADSRASILDAPIRTFDVARFVGDPTRARSLLGWSPRVTLEAGLSRLIEDYRRR